MHAASNITAGGRYGARAAESGDWCTAARSHVATWRRRRLHIWSSLRKRLMVYMWNAEFQFQLFNVHLQA
jgi:hypothetical protein